MVMAAGSVMNEPSKGPIVRIANHHAAGVAPPKSANFFKDPSANWRIGRELAIAMITTTKIGSVKLTPLM